MQTIQTAVDQESIDLSFPKKLEPSTNQYDRGVVMEETMRIDLGLLDTSVSWRGSA